MAHHHLTGPSEQGSVVLDIGDDIGAAVVRTTHTLAGSEIEIRRVGMAWDGTHVAVRERHVGGEVIFAALFPEVARGHYEVRVRDDEEGPVASFAVEPGRVSDACLSAKPATP